MKAIRGAVLDVDGTLVDSNDAHTFAWVRALEQHGVSRAFSEVRCFIGMGGDKLLPAVAGIDAESEQGKRISAARARIFQQEFLPSVRAFPQAQPLLERMKANGLKLVVASSAKKKELGALLEICGAADLIEAKTSADDAERSKPDPDIVHAALDQIGLPREQVVMLGDTPYDVSAARQAGIAIVALRCGGWNSSALEGAIAVYENPADLLAHYDASPFAG